MNIFTQIALGIMKKENTEKLEEENKAPAADAPAQDAPAADEAPAQPASEEPATQA